MKRFYSIYILLALMLMAVVACDEFERTLKKSPVVEFKDLNGIQKDTLLANGSDLAVVWVDLQSLPFSGEEVIVTTTHGALFNIMETAFDTSLQQLELTPFSQEFALYLQAGTEPADEVKVVVKAGNQVGEETVMFKYDDSVKKPVISFANLSENTITSLVADGKALGVIEVDLGNVPPSKQQITLTTSHGSVFQFTETDFSTAAKEIVLETSKQTIKALLQSDTEPIENVLITATVGDDLTGKNTISFVLDNRTIAPVITFISLSGDPKISLVADGKDRAVIEIDQGSDPTTQQQITLTTSHGSLFEFTATDFSTENKMLSLATGQQIVKAILKAGAVVEPEVLVTAVIDDVPGYAVIPFTFDPSGCPLSIAISSSSTTLSLGANDEALLTTVLDLEDGSSKEPINIEFFVSHSSLGSVSPMTGIFENTDISATFTPLAIGTAKVTVRATDNRSGCQVVEDSIEITINN